MVRRLLWVIMIATSLVMFGQVQQTPATAPGAAGTQVYQGPVYVPAVPQVTGGYYTGYTGGGFYGITTPTARFDSPQPTAGISLADRAGISTSTPVGTGVQSTLAPTTLVYTNVQPVAEPVSPEAEAAAAAAAAGPAITGPRLAYDLTPSTFVGAGGIGAAPPATMPVSLGEVAVQYKTQTPPTIRRYTNEDVERLNANMKLGGVNINARLGAMPAAPPVQTAQAQAPPPKAPQPSAEAAQPTTPQVGQPQPGRQAPAKELPATSTLLPLLGIFGLAGGGIGLLLRRHRAR